MKEIVFYEKTGCKGNARQKVMLEENGFSIEVKSLLDESWTAELLRPFFGDRPVAEWFNTSAPDVKNRIINPSVFEAEEALEAMIKQPLLIRRPLIEFGEVKSSGFDNYVMTTVLGIDTETVSLEGCQAKKTSEKCNP